MIYVIGAITPIAITAKNITAFCTTGSTKTPPCGAGHPTLKNMDNAPVLPVVQNAVMFLAVIAIGVVLTALLIGVLKKDLE